MATSIEPSLEVAFGEQVSQMEVKIRELEVGKAEIEAELSTALVALALARKELFKIKESQLSTFEDKGKFYAVYREETIQASSLFFDLWEQGQRRAWVCPLLQRNSLGCDRPLLQ